MKLQKVKKITDIKDGDTIIINGGEYKCDMFKNVLVKVTEKYGTEIILNKRRNIFFNLQMHLDKCSWVKEVYILTNKEK